MKTCTVKGTSTNHGYEVQSLTLFPELLKNLFRLRYMHLWCVFSSCYSMDGMCSLAKDRGEWVGLPFDFNFDNPSSNFLKNHSEQNRWAWTISWRRNRRLGSQLHLLLPHYCTSLACNLDYPYIRSWRLMTLPTSRYSCCSSSDTSLSTGE